MSQVAQTVNALQKPYNDNEMAAQPNNLDVFNKNKNNKNGDQTITIALDPNETLGNIGTIDQ